MKESTPPFLEIDEHPKRSAVTDIKFLRAGAKICCVPIVALLVIAALGPAKWAPRTELGWQFDHIVGYFGITLFFCFACTAAHGRRGLHGCRGIAGRPASINTGSVTLSSGCIVWRKRGARGGFRCWSIRAWRWHLNSARDAKSNV